MNDLFTSAETLLQEDISPSLKAILEDYVLDKRFLAISDDLSSCENLKEIAKDRDEWEKKHLAAFTGHWQPETEFAKFTQIKYYDAWVDNSLPMTLRFCWEDYYCGNTDYYERSLNVFKSWLFVEKESKPWISYWNQELIQEIKENMEKILKVLNQPQTFLFGSLVGVSPSFFEYSEEVIMKKIHRFQNLIHFVNRAQAEGLVEIYEELFNYRIEFDPSDPEDGSVSLMGFINSLDKFNPEEINKLIKNIMEEKKEEREKQEELAKLKHYEELKDKFSHVDFKEIEELLKLKKELEK